MRFLASAAALVLLATTLLGCSSDDQDVVVGAPPSPSAPPTPSVPTKPSLQRYVSPSGKDSNPGTIDKPWRTLAWALHKIYFGQVLFVRGGTYHEHINRLRLHPGTASSPITVLAYPGENPVLEGSVSLSRPVYWRIDNLDVTGDPSSRTHPSFMVKVIGGRSWTWQNSEFSGTRGQANVMITGWGVDEPAGFTFAGNCLHGLPTRPVGSSNLFLGAMRSGAHGIVSRNVVFNHVDQPNVQIGSGAGAPNDVKLLHNTIYGGSLGIDVRGRPHQLRINQNIVGGSTAPAMIRFYRGKLHGASVTNNVAVNATQLLRPEARKNVHAYGNLVLTGDPEFVDTTRCDGFRSGLDAMIPYGALTP
jgi:hypothetical protein